jgi:hypothetical protein
VNKPRKPQPLPRFDFIPDFLSMEEADARFEYLSSLGGFNMETGHCTHPPTHATIQFGPRQAYFDCVPKEFRTVSSGPVPPPLAEDLARAGEIYDCTHNSAQVNKHFCQDSKVDSHRDSPPGHISMLSLGAVRDFVLTTSYHKPIATIPLYHGSLLTFYPHDQWAMRHMMPRGKTPSGVCFHIVFRYIPIINTKMMLLPMKQDESLPEEEQERLRAIAKQQRIERDHEYEAAQLAGRIARGTNTPRVWDCHAGKFYPADAEYVGREVRDRRTGEIIRAGTIFENPLHLKLTGEAFRNYAAEKMLDADFRARVEALRGRDLLCWCGPNAEFCHAKVWLELANAVRP